MFRNVSRLPRRALVSATLAGTAVGVHESRDKLSIYPEPTPDILLVDTPSELEKQIGGVRRQIQGTYKQGHDYVQGWVSKWIGVEHAVENRVKSIVTAEEPLTPGILYVGISTLTASIISRNRLLPTRLLLPPLFLVFSARHFLPKTTGNLSSYLGSLEDKYLPAVSEKHEIAKAHSAMTWERVKEATKGGKESLESGALGAVDFVQEKTGLKLKETLGWQKRAVEKLEKDLEVVKSELVDEAKKIEKETEKRIEDVKTHV